MIDVFATSSLAASITATYSAINKLYKIHWNKQRDSRLIRTKKELKSMNIILPKKMAANDLIIEILKQIQNKQKKKRSDFSEKEMKQVISELLDILKEKSEADPNYDEKSGNKLLLKMRKKYPSNYFEIK